MEHNSNGATTRRRARSCSSPGSTESTPQKRRKLSPSLHNPRFEFFDSLPDDLVVDIISILGASASCPADFINLLHTSRRLKELGLNPLILSNVSPKAFAFRAQNWSPEASNFMKLCADAGNIEASYTLGMIKFYCEGDRDLGRTLITKAAVKSHADALYSLSIIFFNGSGRTKDDKDLRSGVALSARAGFLGHTNALRELGHCLQDGYGVRKNVSEGRRFLMQANAREIASIIPNTIATLTAAINAENNASTDNTNTNTNNITTDICANDNNNTNTDNTTATATTTATTRRPMCIMIPVPIPKTKPPKSFASFEWITSLPNPSLWVTDSGSPLMSDFGCKIPQQEPHPANRFLMEWFKLPGVVLGEELRLCCNEGCGRPETRKHEFRRCSVCGAANYCSRACQALDWKRRHQEECRPMDRVEDVEVNADDADENNANEDSDDEGNGDENEMVEVNEVEADDNDEVEGEAASDDGTEEQKEQI